MWNMWDISGTYLGLGRCREPCYGIFTRASARMMPLSLRISQECHTEMGFSSLWSRLESHVSLEPMIILRSIAHPVIHTRTSGKKLAIPALSRPVFQCFKHKELCAAQNLGFRKGGMYKIFIPYHIVLYEMWPWDTINTNKYRCCTGFTWSPYRLPMRLLPSCHTGASINAGWLWAFATFALPQWGVSVYQGGRMQHP